jgi:uncharacterized RDD family membrane protein YckC
MEQVVTAGALPSEGEQVGRIARMGDRAIATIFDQIALFPMFFLAIFAIGIKNGEQFENGAMNLHGGEALFAFFLMFLFGMTYYITAEALFAGTLGKHMMGIQVRSTLRNPVSSFQSIVRNLFRLIDVIGLYLVGLLVAIISKNNQRIGDLAAGTMVFEAKTDRIFAAIMWVLWMAISFSGVLLLTRFVES